MTYKYYSQTASGWTIETDPNVKPEKRWRAVHPEFGTKYFAEHDEILKFTVSHMAERFEEWLKKGKQ